MVRYIKIFLKRAELSLMSDMTYRLNFVLMLIQSIINTTLGLLTVSFIYNKVDLIAGWTEKELLILICSSQIVNQMYRGLVLPNHYEFLSRMEQGDFDIFLLRPISLFFSINLGEIDFSSLLSGVVPVLVLLYNLLNLKGQLTVVHSILFVVLLLIGVMILTLFMMMLYTFTFYFTYAKNLIKVYYIIIGISEKPKEILNSKKLVSLFTFVIPAICLAIIPTEILLGKSQGIFALISIAVLIALIVICNQLTRHSLKKYSGSNS